MAQTVQPQVFINYISQRKKIIVSAYNSPTQLIIKTDGNLNEVYNFQIIDSSRRIVQLDTQARYQIYGTLTDAKNIQHILFFTNSFSITNNVLSFVINTHTSQYQKYIKGINPVRINISIVKRKGDYSSMVLRDVALAYERPDIGGIPTQIVYQDIFTTVVPLSTAFGAGNLISLTETIEDQGESREVVTFAFGTNLSTSYDNQFVIGYNNTPDATKAFIVANSGNIFTVDYEGNVEAGDLNVGAISATSITVSGEDLNQVIDDKVEYLSTSIDDKLEATSGWINETFETKESATQTFNELEQDIDGISSFVSGLPTDIALKADQTDLDAISSFVSGLPQDINDISNAMNQKADKEKLNDLSGTVEGLAETKADLSALQEVDGKFANYTPTETIVETYATKTSLDDYLPRSEYVDTQYTAGSGLALSGEGLSTFVLTATIPSIEGLATEENLQIVSGAVDDISAFVSGLPTDIAAKANQDEFEAISGKAIANETAIGEINTYLESIPTTYATIDTLSTVSGALADDIDSLSTKVGQIEGGLDNYATIDQVEQISGFVSGLPTDISAKAAQTDVDYISSFVSGLPTDIAAKASQTDLDYVSSFVSGLPEDIAAKANQTDVDYISAFVSGLPTDIAANTTAIGGVADRVTAIETSGLITSDEVDTKIATATTDMATQTWVEEQGYLTAHQSLDDYYNKTQVDTALALKANAADVYDKNNTYNKTEVDSAIQTASGNIENWANGKFLTEHQDITGLATKTDVANEFASTSTYIGTVSGNLHNEITSAVSGMATEEWVEGHFLSSLTSADIPEEFVTETELATELEPYAQTTNVTTAITNATSGKADLSTVQAVDDKFANYYTSSQVDQAIATAVEDIPSTVYTGADGIKVEDGVISLTASISDLTNDSEFATSAQVSSIVEGYGYITNAALDDYAQLSDIPTGNAQLQNTAQYITAADIPTSYVERTELTAYIEKSASGEFATSGQMTELSTYVQTLPTENTTYSSSGVIKINEDNVIYLDGDVGETYSAGFGLALDEHNEFTLTGTVLSGSTHIDITDNVISLVGDVGKTYSGTETGGIEVDNENNTISISANFLSSNALEGYAEQSWVEQNFLTGTTAIPTKTSDLTNDSGYITINDVPPGTLYEAGEGLATSGESNNIFYLTATIPTDANISGIASAVVEDLSTTIRSGLASTSDIPTTVAELTDSSDYAKVADLTAYIEKSASGEFATSGQMTELSTYVQGLPTTSDIPTDDDITGLAKDYVDTLNIATTYATKDELSSKANTADVYSKTVADQTFAPISLTSDVDTLKDVSGQWATASGNYYTKEQVVPSTSAAMYEAISGDVEDQITSKGYITNSELPVVSTYVQGTGISITSSDTNQYTVAFDNSQLGYITGYNEGTGIKIDNGEISLTAAIPNNSDITDIASTVIHNYVVASGLVTGTGLFYDETDNSLNVVLSAANDSNMIVSADNNGVVWLSSVAQGGGGGGTTYTAGNGIDLTNNIISVKLSGGSNVTLSTDQNGYIVISSTGGGGGGDVDIPTDTADLTNGAGFITLSAISNKQKVYPYSSGNLGVPDGNQITYNRAFEIFKTTYLTETGYTPLLQFHEVNVPNGSLASNEVATFEEWMYLSGVDVPSSEFALYPDLELIGELPATLEAGKTHVFVRRIIYGSSTQYVSYAYSF